MIQLFFKTRDQMGPAARSLTKAQADSLLGLIDALCLDDEGCNTSLMAKHFKNIELNEARMHMEVHRIPTLFTELYLSFPAGNGHNGMLKLFRWRENRQTKLGLGTSDHNDFSIKQVPAGALRDAADSLFEGLNGTSQVKANT